MNPETKKIQRGWYYVIEPDNCDLSDVSIVKTKQGNPLSIRNHGSNISGIASGNKNLEWAAFLRIFGVLEEILSSDKQKPVMRVTIQETEEVSWIGASLTLSATFLEAQESRHSLKRSLEKQKPDIAFEHPSPPSFSHQPTQKVLFFESLMNSNMEYNDAEMSGGVLHMVSSISHLDVEPVFAKVKMPIEGDERPVQGLERLSDVLKENQIGLVCISLLEGYWDGVIKLIARLRELGCRARIAVGGVMPTLTPEHVAVHLPDVSFICRGAGEYFLPKLVQILGNSDIDTPLSQEQLQAFAQLKGLIVRAEQDGQKILVSADSAQVVQVEDLNRVSLNLEYVKARHLVGGVEICTSRGCIHRCTFCNIIGRESYQARSSENIIELLEKYHQHYRSLFGNNIPSNAWRLHIADDDFACDKPRAAQFFREILNTPFRLSSVQVSVADLCRKENGKLLPVLDPEICDSILPECFADHGKGLPIIDYIEDHKPRAWSSYLQIGVETFCNQELIRLGKGYRVEHIQTVVDEMAKKQLHVDAYFIQSNSETTAEELLEGLIELVRLKIKHPVYFHVRYPPVPHLVSYFPSATHRKHIRKGKSEAHQLRGFASVANYPEYDYPFVSHDIPSDPWVSIAIKENFFSGEDLYTKSFTNLYQIWKKHLETLEDVTENTAEKERGKRLLRMLDDLPRTMLFQRLRDLRAHNQKREQKQDESLALHLTSKILGEPDAWKLAFQRFISLGTQRMVIIPTWQCELRCRYCYIRKQDGRVMPWETAQKSIDLLMSSHRPTLILQFFGGEALLEWKTIQKAIAYATQEAKRFGKQIQFLISTNGWSLDEEKLDWLAEYNVKLELSLDGDSETQNHSRQAFRKDEDSYQHSIATKRTLIQSRHFFYDVIMVVPPRQISKLAQNFIHIADQNWKRIQINYALGMLWTENDKKIFAQELMKIGSFLEKQWAKGDSISFINLEAAPINMRLNGEITVDWDGTLHSGNAFLLKGRKAGELILGDVDALQNFDRYWLDVVDNDVLLDSTYSPEITANNLEVGKIFNSWIRWMRKKYLQEIEARTGNFRQASALKPQNSLLSSNENTEVLKLMRTPLSQQREILKRWGYGDIGLLILYSSCDGNCFFCRKLAVNNMKSSKFTNQQMLDSWFDSPPPREILVGGTEPMSHPLLFDMLRKLSHFSCSIELMTSGIRLQTRETLQMLNSLGVSKLCIPVYATKPDLHDEIVGVSGQWKQVKHCIQLAKEVGIKITIHTLALRRNLGNLSELALWAQEHSSEPLVIAPLRKKDSLFTYTEEAIRFGELEPILTNIPVQLTGFPDCFLPNIPRGGPKIIQLYFQGQEKLQSDMPCNFCTRKDRCDGVVSAHLQFFGEQELVPFQD